MATQIRSNLLDFFTESKLPALEAIIESKKNTYPSMVDVLFNTVPMTSDIAQTTTLSGLRNPVIVGENETVSFQVLKPGYSNTVTYDEWRTAYRISHRMVKDGKENLIRRATESFSHGMYEVKEIGLANIFNNGFATNGYDGVPLFSTSHPLENGDGALGANRPTSASEFSLTSYKEARNILQDLTDENGRKLNYKAQWLILPQLLQDEGYELLKSAYNPENANNTVNTVYEHTSLLPGGYWPYLTSDTAFFLATDKTYHGLEYKPRFGFETDSDYDKHAKAYEIMASEAWTQTYNTWRGLVGNPGA